MAEGDRDENALGSEPSAVSSSSGTAEYASSQDVATEPEAAPDVFESMQLESLRGELVIYLASGKAKHPRLFWVTPEPGSRNLLLHWGKKLNGPKAKAEKLLRVLDRPTMLDAEQLFHDMDDDKSGYLDATEVAALYKKARGEKLSKGNLSAAMREMDSDGNGQVSMDEFKSWWLDNGGDLEQHRSRAFTFVCHGGMEVLVVAPDEPTKQHWVSGCRSLLPAVPDSGTKAVTLSGLLTLYLLTGQKKHSRFFWVNAESKQISWGKTLRAKTCKTETLVRVINVPSVPDAQELFRQIDKDNSGYLDSKEVAELYKKARGEKLAGKKLKEAMRVMDGDGNNQVSLAEFQTWWANNGGDLEQHRERAMTFVCGSGVEVIVVAPDAATKQRWVDGCSTLGLLEQVDPSSGGGASSGSSSTVDGGGSVGTVLQLQQLEESLPEGWETSTSQSTGEVYYVNTLTGESTYDRPTARADTLQTELQVMTPAGPARVQEREPEPEPEPEPQLAGAVSKKDAKASGKKAAARAKQAEKEAKKQAKLAKKAEKEKEKAKKKDKTSKKNKGNEGDTRAAADAAEDAVALASAAAAAGPDLEAFAKDLPSGWEPTISRSSGDVYYVNTVSGESTYDRPTERAFTDSFLSTAGPETDCKDHVNAPCDSSRSDRTLTLNCAAAVRPGRYSPMASLRVPVCGFVFSCGCADALPEGWETGTSRATGETYYVNTLTGESTYDPPTQPAAGAGSGSGVAEG